MCGRERERERDVIEKIVLAKPWSRCVDVWTCVCVYLCV